MFFLNPSFLWALLGLVVPVAIHLWSKKEGKTIKVGSIKFLQESDSQKSSSIKLNEFWLLLLRMLLITILVFILAEPRLHYKTENSPITYLVEKSLLSSSEVKTLTDSLNNTVEVRFLETDFPEYEPEIVKDTFSETPNYWKLAREAETLKTDSIVVFTNAFVSGIKGKRPEISKNIHWINLNPGTVKTNLVGAIKRGEEIERISVISDTEEFKFQKEKQNLSTSEIETEFVNIPVVELDTLRVQIYSEEEFRSENKYIKASFLALGKYLEQPIEIINFEEENFNSNSGEILIWLSEEPSPKTEGKVVKFRRDSLANSIIEPGNFENEYHLTGQLNSENIVEEHLAEQLLEMFNLYTEINKEAEKYDFRVMNLALLKPNFGEASESTKNRNGRDISKYLWILLSILILSERALSRYRKQ
ncbi:BatA domain-containing protein [Salegentibacter salegens]|uniref:N-terminal double-transmembrane domain-containing protein n=1 Tax=Salegentibacter salegens TaxID=143223 RepID=A0A1M7KBG6_9FLAO|nr:BatA domain-containing protein [Salegentibacter salegens]PRX44379.1 putative membrane protein (TIGR02226 family) [Salegentibacter salegens]SHM62353.1 N-terminal double-transmembrane domain-containing protein [Salegentibacter salegens]